MADFDLGAARADIATVAATDGRVYGIDNVDAVHAAQAAANRCASDHLPAVLAELAETRRLVAEWLWNANSGRGCDPGDLQWAFEGSGRALDPEFDVIEAAEESGRG